jgi:hopene-associated glycosyltransferase HpnB
LTSAAAALAGLALVAWAWLLLFHWRFWIIGREPSPPAPSEWPAVAVVIPARNEAALIGETVRALLNQDYAGALELILVDDGSEDGTADRAREAAEGGSRGLTVVAALERPPGWAGKVWAMEQGLRQVQSQANPPDFLLFTDADIAHGPGVLRSLVCLAEASSLGLASYMVRLRCASPSEKWLVPAFVYFFRMLYPFQAVSHSRSRVAGAAGGAMLVRLSALTAIGGMEAIRDALIDDCTLARALKRAGFRLWLGMGRESRSTRPYGGVRDFVAMVARSAYTQLRYSPLALAGCLAGLGLLFAVPPVAAVFGAGWVRWMGAAAWLLMALSAAPMYRFYGLSTLRGLAMPAVAAVYGWATFLSAWEHWHGRGGMWKGRVAGVARSR